MAVSRSRLATMSPKMLQLLVWNTGLACFTELVTIRLPQLEAYFAECGASRNAYQHDATVD